MNIKITKSLMAVAVSICMLTSACKKELNLLPYNSVTTSAAFTTANDFKLATVGMYREMINSTQYYRGSDNFSFIASNDILSDNAISFSLGRGTGLTYENWQYNGLSTSFFFQDGYAIIRSANSILENINNLKDTTKNNVQGEALAIRSFVYFDLDRIFAKTYANASASDLGVPFVTSTANPFDKPARDKVKANYDQITADLEKAATLINTNNGVGRFNKASVYGLLSRLYLYKGDWANTISSATKSLAIKSDPGSLTAFPGIWTDATEAGVLLKLQIKDVDNIAIGTSLGQSVNKTVRAEYVPAFDFYQLYSASDVRKTAYYTTSTFQTIPIIAVTKYASRAGGNQNTVDIKLIRVAEVLLNRAEAYSRSGNDPAALVDLNTLRQNRYTNYVPAAETGQPLLNAIALQRRLELAFEGDRFFDLKRLNLPVVRNATYGDGADGTGRKYLFTTLPAGDPRFQLPIDQNSINADPNLVQNPGY